MPLSAFRLLKISAVAAALALAGCSDSLKNATVEAPDQAEVISASRLHAYPDLRQQVLSECAEKAPSDPRDMPDFLATNFGQTCTNAKTIQTRTIELKAYSESLKR